MKKCFLCKTNVCEAKPMRKVYRRAGWILLTPFLILLLLLILIYTPPIQNLLKQKAVQYASEAAGMGITIDRIGLSFPLKLVAEGIQAVSEQDTLIYARRLDLHVKLLPLFKKQVDINGITLKQARLNSAQLIDGMLLKGSIGEVSLSSHGIDLTTQKALVNKAEIKDTDLYLLLSDTATEAEKDSTSAPLNWFVTVERLSLENVKFQMEIPADTMDLLAYVNSALLRDGEIDLYQQLYKVERVEIEKSEFDYNSGNSLPLTTGLDPSHLAIRDINLDLDSIYYQGRNIGTFIDNLSLNESSGLAITTARGGISMNDSLIYIPDLRLETPYSRIELNAKADWEVINTRNSGELTAYLNADIGKKDILLFAGNLSEDLERNYPFRPLALRMDMDGNMSDLEIKQLRAELPGAFRLFATGRAGSIMDEDNRTARLNLAAETGNLNFLLSLLPADQRARFAIPQGMELQGTANLTGPSIQADLTLQEGRGNLHVDGVYNMNVESYQAQLDVNNLQINHFMPRDSFEIVTATINIDGRGTDIFSSSTRMNVTADIRQFSYGKYDLSDTQVTASLEQTVAQVTLESHNSLIDLYTDINGRINRNGVDLQMNLDATKIDFYALGFTNEPLELAFNLNAQVASDLNETHTLSGTVGSMRIKTLPQNYYPKDIQLMVATTPDTISAVIDAGDLHFVMRSAEGIEGLINESSAFIAELNSQIDEKFIDHNELRSLLPDVFINLIAGSQNPLNDYLKTRGFGFRELALDLETSSLEGIKGNSHVYAFARDSIRLDTIRFNIYQDTTAIKFGLGVRNNPSNRQVVFRATVDGQIRENTAEALLKYYNADENMGVELGASAELVSDGISIHLLPEEPTIVFRPFQLNQDNYIFISNDNHIRANVSLLDSNGSGIRVYSLPSDTTVLQDMAIELRHIDLEEIQRIVPFVPDMSGILSAEAHYVKTEDYLQVAADIHVDSLVYEGNSFDSISLSAVYLPGDRDDHHLDALLTYSNEEVMTVQGVYYTSEGGSLDADANFNHFPMNIANPFIPDGIAQLTGDMDGALSIEGNLNTPQVNGELTLDSVTVVIPQYGGVFHLDTRPVRIQESQIAFNRFNIYSTQSTNPFVVDGMVNFADLSEIVADLNLNATGYELVNAQRTSESLLYGRVIVDVAATVKGELDALVVRGDISIQGNTNVTYVLTDSPLVAQDRMGDMVTFVDFRDSTTYVQEEVPTVELGGMDMLMTVHIDQGAKINVDLTPDRSSYIELEGEGDLSLQYTELDGLGLNGRYTLSSGALKYTLISFLAREFTINDGSYVEWSGNPMDPYVDITAVNHVRASVNDGGSNRYVGFNAELTIKNRLENLQLIFGLDAPEDLSIRYELAAMSEEELSKQAVAIMITGTYMGPSGNGGNIGDNALNALLQGAIQGVAGNALKTIDITLDVESEGGVPTDYGFTFSKRFWNDRVSVIIGGKLSTGESEQSGRQTFIDNVSLEYRLDNTGTRYIRLFHDVNYDSVLDGEVIETGGGIVLRKKMAHLKELFIFRRKKKEVTTNNENVSYIQY